jgi:hypothetical protein
VAAHLGDIDDCRLGRVGSPSTLRAGPVSDRTLAREASKVTAYNRLADPVVSRARALVDEGYH